MANLRDLLYGYEEPVPIEPGEFMVYNTNITSDTNGGCCCLWTVPSGASFAIFEMWGGGSSAGCGRYCQQGAGGSSGGYAIKTCAVSPGDQIQICAAGSTGCSNSCEGCLGNCTHVCSLGGGGGDTWLALICYACSSTVQNCCFFGSCYTCCTNCYCCYGRSTGTDFCLPSVKGNGHSSQGCKDPGISWAANAPHIPGPKLGRGGCCVEGGSIGFGIFPGGGGGPSSAYSGNCCCGSPGAGGLVYVVYF